MSEQSESILDRRSRVIEDIRARFEAGWTADSHRLGDFVRDAPEEDRPELFRVLLAVEQEQRENAGQPLSATEARNRFAAIGPWAVAILDDVFPPEPVLILDVTHGPATGRSFPLAGHATFTLGRQAGLQISLPEDPHLSRVHCLVEVNSPLARLVDLGSKSGTMVNGLRVKQADLREGDEVRAGLTAFRVRIPPTETGTLSVCEFTFPTGVAPPLPSSLVAIPGYRLGAELGRGAMGVVYRAIREADGHEVAIKTLLPAVPPTPTTLGRFLREAAILRQLAHPNIVGFREAGSVGGLVYFVMEYVVSANAATVVARDGPLSPERTLDWAAQFLEALAHAHDKGFVHRDVKPSNLLVTSGGGAGEVVKVSDFGLARAYEESCMSGLTVANAAGGTPQFMSPEQVTDFRNVRPTADQYGAAATLYYLLTGQTVYERTGSVQEALCKTLLEDPLPLRPGSPALPAPFGPVICRALARNPAARFPDARAMRAALLGG